MVSKCVICGTELPTNITQLCFATKNKGVESACMKHEFSSELKNYIKENGGRTSILEALDKNFKKGDVAEVKHGKWICLEAEIGLHSCSLCEHNILRAKCNYCPNCGAKMDGGKKE